MSRSAGRIGWFLVWAVVFCDIGTSVYYVPGILHATSGDQSALFVLATMAAFLLLSVKVVEITRRFPSGGGVVSLADRAFGTWWGCLGGQLIMVDYFLTVAISAASGVYYLNGVLGLGSAIMPVTVLCIGALAGLNIVGLKESARVSTLLALVALVVDLVVVGLVLARVPLADLAAYASRAFDLSGVTPWHALVGYSGAWLAFSGLESLSQLSPAMRDLGRTPRVGMIAVIVSVVLTAPMLTFLSTMALPSDAPDVHAERLVAELAQVWGGHALEIAVILTAGSLLFFAANTAIVGNYHVQLALTRREFLPEPMSALGRRYQTPHWAILLSTVVPMAVVVATGADLHRLGALYAFGLLGCFVLNSVGVDVLRWRDGDRGANFVLGVLTSVLVVVAFAVNLTAKPSATLYGGVMTLVGMAVAFGTHEGWFDRLLSRIPRLAPPRQVDTVETTVYTLDQAAALPRHELPGILVASRGAARKLFREAADRARARGQDRVYLLYVDEVPGLFYPQLAAPTQEGLTVLEAGAEIISELGIEPVRIWGLSHSAATTTAEAAEALGCDTVVIGATQRTFLWQALRGKFIQDLLRQLPGTIRLIVVG